MMSWILKPGITMISNYKHHKIELIESPSSPTTMSQRRSASETVININEVSYSILVTKDGITS